jgi:hypothetical protein
MFGGANQRKVAAFLNPLKKIPLQKDSVKLSYSKAITMPTRAIGISLGFFGLFPAHG